MIARSGRWPWRTSRWRPSSVCLLAWPLRKAATSASTACANRARAPSRRTSVSGSEHSAGWISLTTVSWVTAYHSFGGEVEARTPPRYAASSPHAVTNFRAYLVQTTSIVVVGTCGCGLSQEPCVQDAPLSDRPRSPAYPPHAAGRPKRSGAGPSGPRCPRALEGQRGPVDPRGRVRRLTASAVLIFTQGGKRRARSASWDRAHLPFRLSAEQAGRALPSSIALIWSAT